MSLPILTVAFMFALAISVVFMTWKRQPVGAKELPYIKNRVLFSPAERSLLGVLEQAVGKEYRIFGKVRVADVVSIRDMEGDDAWERTVDRIGAKHFDFVLCDRNDFAIRCAVELNDPSHHSPRDQEADALLEGVCKTVSLPFVQIPGRREYSFIDLRKTIRAALAAD